MECYFIFQMILKKKYHEKINWYILYEHHKHAAHDIINEYYDFLMHFCEQHIDNVNAHEFKFKQVIYVNEEWCCRIQRLLKTRKELRCDIKIMEGK